MRLMLAMAIGAFAAAAFPRNVEGQNNALCFQDPLVTTVSGDCTPTTVELKALEPCCGLQSIAGNAGSSNTQTCRYTETDKPFCNSLICAEASVDITFQTEMRPGTCCETCSCWGDPHCESFNGTTDQWVLCDARVKNPAGCALSKTQCTQELDHNGNACKWKNKYPNLSGWNVGLQGSPCVPDTSNGEAATMDMYSFQGFTTRLTLGERGVIDQIFIQDGDKKYILTAENCYSDPKKPWRAEEGANSGPSDPNWLPYSWTPKKQDGSYLWTVSGLDSNVVINIRCTRNVMAVGGTSKKGAPRINVESLIEPEGTERTNARGFCVSGEIDKGESTSDRSELMDQQCLAHGDELEAARAVCSKAINLRTLHYCKLSFCQVSYPGKNTADCIQSIQSNGWGRVFCAANTLISKNVGDCHKSNACQQCVSDISDFGWQYAVQTWLNHNTGVGSPDSGQCKTYKDLPTSLTSCQQGITIQYENAPNEWVDFVAVPFGTKLCGGKLSISDKDGADAQNIFTKRVRLAQCSDSSCLTDQCTPEVGWAATFNFNSPTVVGQDYYRLVQEGKLICNPNRGYENNPTGCIDNFIPLCQQCQFECPNA